MKSLLLKYKFKNSLILLIAFLLNCSLQAQEKQYQAATVAFYNLENLFDIYESAGYIDGFLDYQDEFYHKSVKVSDIPTLDTVDCKCALTEENLKGKRIIRELILQKEFTPNGPKAWDSIKYNQKLTNLSKAISEIGRDITGTAPVAVGVSEIENREVLQDLINKPALRPYNYGIVHYNSWDKRGIDNGFIYQKDRVVVTKTHKYELEIYRSNGNRSYTRDILRVDALVDGEPVHFLVNHWPSRSGGEAASAPRRKAAAALLKKAFDEIRAEDPNAKIIAMGDFNDDPVNESIKDVLGAIGDQKKLNKNTIFNHMRKMYDKGFGTLAYRDGWNLFDQIITTTAIMGNDYNSYQIFKTGIFSPSYLISQEGRYKGYPNRMYGGDTYRAAGYSDHFPVYTILLREVK